MIAAVSRLVRALSFLFVALSGTPAHAEDAAPARARLVWTRAAGAEDCIDSEALQQGVARRWGRQVFVDDPAAPIVVKGRARRDPRGTWAVVLELERSDGASLGSRRIV